MPRRRHVLATVGTALATAGCLSGADSPGTDDQHQPVGTKRDTTSPPATAPDPARFTEPVTVGGTTVRFSGPAVQHSYFRLTTPDSMAVSAADGQFLFVGVVVESGPAPGMGAFDLVVGGETYALTTVLVDRNPYSVPVAAGNGRPYRAEDGAGWVGADVPAPLPETEPMLRLTVDGESRLVTLPGVVADELGEPAPAFSFGAVSAPDSVGPDEAISVEVPVTNDGAGPGTVRAVVNEAGPMYAPHRLEATLAPGESTTLAESITTHLDYDFGSDRIRFKVVAPGVDESQTVTIEDSS
jgi:hypothetical protein